MLLFAWILLCPIAVRADTVCVISPDSAQTYSFSSIARKKLIWDEDRKLLQAIITFTNVPYADRVQPKVEEFFAFGFPGVTYDPTTRIFSATGEKGKIIPVAVWKDGLISDWIEPGPKTQIFVFKKSGSVQVTLAATTEEFPNPMGTRWVERNEGFCLQHLISGD
ncbi:MAG: hypothetical protein L0Z48_05170 [candidate division Zixibacteria bacterium]|nr:hypothetical protein [candidate division Zixibacteria bacterium]